MKHRLYDRKLGGFDQEVDVAQGTQSELAAVDSWDQRSAFEHDELDTFAPKLLSKPEKRREMSAVVDEDAAERPGEVSKRELQLFVAGEPPKLGSQYTRHALAGGDVKEPRCIRRAV